MKWYTLNKEQISFIEKKVIPMLKNLEEDEIIWNGIKMSTTLVIQILGKIVGDGKYGDRQAEFMNDLRTVYQQNKKK